MNKQDILTAFKVLSELETTIKPSYHNAVVQVKNELSKIYIEKDINGEG